MEIECVETPSQLEAVRALWMEYYHFILERYGVDMGHDYFQAEMAALPGPYAPPTGHLVLARVGGRVAGCAGLRQVTPETGELKRLYVRPGSRGQGAGRALVTALIHAAREMGYTRLRVHTAPFLTEALGLYGALGFETVEGAGPGGTGEMVMVLALD